MASTTEEDQARCATCNKSAAEAGIPRLLRCGKCLNALASYCNVGCQKEAWLGHKDQCAAWTRERSFCMECGEDKDWKKDFSADQWRSQGHRLCKACEKELAADVDPARRTEVVVVGGTFDMLAEVLARSLPRVYQAAFPKEKQPKTVKLCRTVPEADAYCAQAGLVRVAAVVFVNYDKDTPGRIQKGSRLHRFLNALMDDRGGAVIFVADGYTNNEYVAAGAIHMLTEGGAEWRQNNYCRIMHTPCEAVGTFFPSVGKLLPQYSVKAGLLSAASVAEPHRLYASAPGAEMHSLVLRGAVADVNVAAAWCFCGGQDQNGMLAYLGDQNMEESTVLLIAAICARAIF